MSQNLKAIKLNMFLINVSHLFILPVNTEMPHYRAINSGFEVICSIMKSTTQMSEMQAISSRKEKLKKDKADESQRKHPLSWATPDLCKFNIAQNFPKGTYYSFKGIEKYKIAKGQWKHSITITISSLAFSPFSVQCLVPFWTPGLISS